jgi:hypothetical protein
MRLRTEMSINGFSSAQTISPAGRDQTSVADMQLEQPEPQRTLFLASSGSLLRLANQLTLARVNLQRGMEQSQQ